MAREVSGAQKEARSRGRFAYGKGSCKKYLVKENVFWYDKNG